MNWKRGLLPFTLMLILAVLVLSAQAQDEDETDQPGATPIDGRRVGKVMDEIAYSHWSAAVFDGDGGTIPVEVQVETVPDDENCYVDIDSDATTIGRTLESNSDVLRFYIRWSEQLNGFCISFGSIWGGIAGHQQRLMAGLRVTDRYSTPVLWQTWEATNDPSLDGALIVWDFVPSDGSGQLYHFVLEMTVVDMETGEGPIRGYSAWFEQKPRLMFLPIIKESIPAGGECSWTLTVSYENQSKSMPFIAVTVPIESVGTFGYGKPLKLEWRDASGNQATLNSVVVQSEVRENYWEYDFRSPVEFESPTTYVGRHANDGYVYPPDTYRLAAGIEHNIILDYYEGNTRCLRAINVTWDPP